MGDQDFNADMDDVEFDAGADRIAGAIVATGLDVEGQIRATVAALGAIICRASAADLSRRFDLVADLGQAVAAVAYGAGMAGDISAQDRAQ